MHCGFLLYNGTLRADGFLARRGTLSINGFLLYNGTLRVNGFLGDYGTLCPPWFSSSLWHAFVAMVF